MYLYLLLKTSVTRLDDFLNLSMTNFLSEVVKMFDDLLGYFERHHFLSKTAVDTFWATFGNEAIQNALFCALFYSAKSGGSTN